MVQTGLDDLILRLRTEGFSQTDALLKVIAVDVRNIQGAMVPATKATKALGQEVKKTGDGFLGLNDHLGTVIKKVALWTVATGAIFGTLRLMRQGVASIIEHDQQLINLRKVYSGWEGDLKGIRVQVMGLAREMKSLHGPAFEAAVAVARTGRTGADVTRLTRAGLVAQNIAELDAADAVRLLNAALIQFNQESDQAIRILDEWNELSNRTPATTQDLAEAVSVAGSVFEQTGASIQFLNASTAALVEITAKSGNIVGRAQRTMAIYSQRLSTVNKLGKIGIDVYNRLTGEYRGIDTILFEIAKKWDILTDAQRANIAQTMAGARQQQFFLALMENQDMVIDNLLIQLEALGSAMRENDLFLTSLTKKWDGLINSLERTAITLGEGGVKQSMKFLIDILATMVDILNHATGAISALTAASTFLFVRFLALAGMTSPVGLLAVGMLNFFGIMNMLTSSTRQAASALREMTEESARLAQMGESLKGIVDTLQALFDAGDAEQLADALERIRDMEIFGNIISGATSAKDAINLLRTAAEDYQRSAIDMKLTMVGKEIEALETKGFWKGGIEAERQRRIDEAFSGGDGGDVGYIDQSKTISFEQVMKESAPPFFLEPEQQKKLDEAIERRKTLRGQRLAIGVKPPGVKPPPPEIDERQYLAAARRISMVMEQGIGEAIASGFEHDAVMRAMNRMTTQFGQLVGDAVSQSLIAGARAKGIGAIGAGLMGGLGAGIVSGGIGLLANLLFQPEEEDRRTDAVEENTIQLRALNENIRDLTRFVINAPAGFTLPSAGAGLPEMAAGGIVTGSGQAVVHAGEVIANPEQLAKMFVANLVQGMQGTQISNTYDHRTNISEGAIVVHAQPGQSPEAIAEAVQRKLVGAYELGGHTVTGV